MSSGKTRTFKSPDRQLPAPVPYAIDRPVPRQKTCVSAFEIPDKCLSGQQNGAVQKEPHPYQLAKSIEVPALRISQIVRGRHRTPPHRLHELIWVWLFLDGAILLS